MAKSPDELQMFDFDRVGHFEEQIDRILNGPRLFEYQVADGTLQMGFNEGPTLDDNDRRELEKRYYHVGWFRVTVAYLGEELRVQLSI